MVLEATHLAMDEQNATLNKQRAVVDAGPESSSQGIVAEFDLTKLAELDGGTRARDTRHARATRALATHRTLATHRAVAHAQATHAPATHRAIAHAFSIYALAAHLSLATHSTGESQTRVAAMARTPLLRLARRPHRTMRSTLRTQHILRATLRAQHFARHPLITRTHAQPQTPTRRDAAGPSARRRLALASGSPADRTAYCAAYCARNTLRATLRTPHIARHPLTIHTHAISRTPRRAATLRILHPAARRTRFRLARRPHRTVRSTPRTQLLTRRPLVTRAHTQPCATRHARSTMCAIRPPRTKYTCQSSHTTALAKRHNTALAKCHNAPRCSGLISPPLRAHTASAPERTDTPKSMPRPPRTCIQFTRPTHRTVRNTPRTHHLRAPLHTRTHTELRPRGARQATQRATTQKPHGPLRPAHATVGAGRRRHANRYAAYQARRGWRQYLRPGLRASPQASPNHQTRYLTA